jgi:hypothetical protein
MLLTTKHQLKHMDNQHSNHKEDQYLNSHKHQELLEQESHHMESQHMDQLLLEEPYQSHK